LLTIMALQILLSQVNGHSLCLPRYEITSLDDLKETIYRLEGINPEDQRIIYNGHDIENDQFCIAAAQEIAFLPLQFSLRGGCSGGKGGFGSLLRSAKSVKKTTNFGSCRDINGRRLRDVENERRLAEWKTQQPRAEGEAVVVKKKRRSEPKETEANEEKDTKDAKLNEIRKKVREEVNSSVEKGLARKKAEEEEKKRKRRDEIENTPKTNNDLFGDSDSDSDSDEEPPTKKQRTQPPQTNESFTSTHTSTSPSQHTPTSIPITSPSLLSTSTVTVTTTTDIISQKCSVEVTKDVTLSPIQVGIKRASDQTVWIDLNGIDLNSFNDVVELESLGLDGLKAELIRLGLKCGGTLKQRAERLWSTKGLLPDNFEPSIRATLTINKKK